MDCLKPTKSVSINPLIICLYESGTKVYRIALLSCLLESLFINKGNSITLGFTKIKKRLSYLFLKKHFTIHLNPEPSKTFLLLKQILLILRIRIF